MRYTKYTFLGHIVYLIIFYCFLFIELVIYTNRICPNFDFNYLLGYNKFSCMFYKSFVSKAMILFGVLEYKII